MITSLAALPAPTSPGELLIADTAVEQLEVVIVYDLMGVRRGLISTVRVHTSNAPQITMALEPLS